MHDISCTICVFTSADDDNYTKFQNRSYNGSAPSSIGENSPITDLIAGALVNISFIYMIFITIFLFAELFIRGGKNNKLRTSYYILIFVGTITYLIMIIMWNLSFITFIASWTMKRQLMINLILSTMARWYYSFEVGIWNLFLSLNRASALLFPVNYDRFWRKKLLIIYIGIILFYPFIVDGWTLFDDCRWKVYSRSCKDFRLRDQWFAASLTSIKAILSLGITIFALWRARKRGSLASSKIETRLTIQTLSASILLIAFSISELIAVSYYYSDEMELYYLFNSLSDLFYSIYYYPVIVILFLVCPTFRSKLFEFYIPKCFRRTSKNPHRSSKVIHTQTITAIPSPTKIS